VLSPRSVPGLLGVRGCPWQQRWALRWAGGALGCRRAV